MTQDPDPPSEPEIVRNFYEYQDPAAVAALSPGDRAEVETALLAQVHEYFNENTAVGWDSFDPPSQPPAGFSVGGSRLRDVSYADVFEFLGEKLAAVNEALRDDGSPVSFALAIPDPPRPICEKDPKTGIHKDELLAELMKVEGGITAPWTVSATVGAATITVQVSIGVRWESVTVPDAS